MKNNKLPGSLSAFLEHAPEGLFEILQVLSAAVSLTDDLACYLMTKSKSIKMAYDYEGILDCIHNSDLIFESEKEWTIDPSIRKFLLEQLNQDPEIAKEAHEILQNISLGLGTEMALPDYIIQGVGLAYHTAVFDAQKALKLYMHSFNADQPGDCWIIGDLARQQQELGYLPEDAIEPAFLQGMAAYRANRWEEAAAHLRCVIAGDDSRKETAVALYALSLMTSSRNATEATLLMGRCLRILEKTGAPDEIYHVRQTLNRLSDSIYADLEDLIQQVIMQEGMQSLLHRMMVVVPQKLLFKALSTDAADVAPRIRQKPKEKDGNRTKQKPLALWSISTPEAAPDPKPREIEFECLPDIGIQIDKQQLSDECGKRIK